MPTLSAAPIRNKERRVVRLFKSPDEKRQEAAVAAKKVCPTCNGTGTVGIGGRGAATASTCGTCGGSGRKS